MLFVEWWFVGRICLGLLIVAVSIFSFWLVRTKRGLVRHTNTNCFWVRSGVRRLGLVNNTGFSHTARLLDSRLFPEPKDGSQN